MSLIFTEPHRTSRSIGTTISPPPWNLPEHRGPSRPPSARRRGNPPSIADHRANPGPHPRFFLPFRLTETGRVPTSHSGIGQTRIFRGQTEPCGSSQRRKILGWPESPMPGGAGREEKCASSQTMQAARPIECRRSPGHSPHETRRHGSRTEDTSEQPTAKMTDRPPGGHDQETRCPTELRNPIPTRPARRPADSRSSQSRQQPPS